MKQSRYPMLIRTLLQAFCVVVFGMSCILSEPLQALDEDKYVQSNENTRAAIDEINEVMRFLFPIVPHKSHFIWNTRHRGILINKPRSGHRHQITLIEHKNAKSIDAKQDENMENNELGEDEDLAFTEEANTNSFQSYANSGANEHLVSDRVPHQVVQVAQPSNLHRQDKQQQPDQRQKQQQRQHQMILDSLESSMRDATKENQRTEHDKSRVDKSNQIKNQLSIIFSKFRSKINSAKHANKQQELTTPTLGKRGPECMRRCIMQGLLHPVQCHSLC